MLPFKTAPFQKSYMKSFGTFMSNRQVHCSFCSKNIGTDNRLKHDCSDWSCRHFFASLVIGYKGQ